MLRFPDVLVSCLPQEAVGCIVYRQKLGKDSVKIIGQDHVSIFVRIRY